MFRRRGELDLEFIRKISLGEVPRPYEGFISVFLMGEVLRMFLVMALHTEFYICLSDGRGDLAPTVYLG